MKAKRWISVLCAVAMTFSLAACGAQSATQQDTETTLTGQVSAIDGSEITLLLGTWTEGEARVPQSADNSDQTLPEAPPDQTEDNNAFTERDGQTPPSKPDADISDEEQPGEIPSGNAPDGQKPDEQPSMPGSFEAGTESGRTLYAGGERNQKGR